MGTQATRGPASDCSVGLAPSCATAMPARESRPHVTLMILASEGISRESTATR
jgi:hypothetical protein